MRSELGKLITAHQDAQKYRPSVAQIAADAGVSRQVVAKWMAGNAGLPLAENLRALARTLGVPYQRVLDAALVDAGYYNPASTKERDEDAQHPAPIAPDDRADMPTVEAPTPPDTSGSSGSPGPKRSSRRPGRH